MSALPLWYSVQSISELTATHTDEILKTLAILRIKTEKQPNKILVHRDDMKQLLAEIGKNINVPYYDLSRSPLPYLDRPWAKSLVEIYKEDFACPASLSPQQGEFLRSLVLNINPKIMLEIGCFVGVSTMWICSALESCNNDGILHSVDFYGDKLPFGPYKHLFLPDALSYIRGKLEKASLTQYNIQHPGNSITIGNEYATLINEKLDMLFIDGDHTVSGCQADFLLYEPHLKVGGYLLFHDIFPEKCGWDGPRAVIDEIISKQPGKYQFVDVNTTPNDYGISVIKKIAE